MRTSVDQFRTNNGAKKGLVFRKLNDSLATRWAGGGLAVTDTAVTVPRGGSRRFAFLVGYSDSNITPLFGVDEEFTEGRYEADVTVWAGSAAAAKQLATANQASFEADFDAALFGKYAIDLSSLGDGARGAVANGGSGDSTGYAELVFSSGPLEELVVFSSDNPIQTADAQSIAQKVASYIDAAGLGS